MSNRKLNFRLGSFEFKIDVNRNESRLRERKIKAVERNLRLKEVMEERNEVYDFGSCDMYR